ncbi:NAD-dependent epimerase/dehydratase family protein [Nonomuraea ferruginea]
MRVVVIGASGHIGTYLVPRLVEAGHDVVAVSRGTRRPYTPTAPGSGSPR